MPDPRSGNGHDAIAGHRRRGPQSHGPDQRHPRSPLGVIVGLLIVMAVLVVAAGAIASHTAGRWDSDRDGPPIPALFLLLGIGAVIVFIVRRIRRTFSPVSAVIEATSQVAHGDFSVRVATSGPPEVQEMVRAFNAMAERLETSDEHRRRMFSDIAHELRTPLSVIQGTAEAVVDGVYPATVEHLLPILDQARQMGRLLTDLQLLSTSEAGQLPLHMEEVDLVEILNDAVQSFSPSAHRQGVRLGPVTHQPVPATVDPVRIRQVVDNLIANAVRFTAEGGSVALGITSMDQSVEIVVRDTGRGMPQEDVARMFERFHKSVDSGGTGLGLAIARSLVEAHGGTIGAESAPDLGTKVTIVLPR
ncbi:MAG TPA: HAMP domain-containing sensor histidine kinase [Thermomicrobiales bacterium]|nr:HAMP domain-containing sensor histidine kinase [Thermomicrobiales bacterium]